MVWGVVPEARKYHVSGNTALAVQAQVDAAAEADPALAMRKLETLKAEYAQTVTTTMVATEAAVIGKPQAQAVQATLTEAERRREAKVRGYEGENCRECGNFTLVRNGTCLKCDTCGGTSGCS